MGERLRRWVPVGVPVVALVGVVAWAVWKAAHPLDDPDVWWHLRLGDELIDQHSFGAPAWSPFATRPWTPSEPLPEMVAAWFERWGGLPAVAWLYGAALVALVATWYAGLRRRVDPPVAAVVTAITVLVANASLTVRPQLVSFALLAVVLAAWLGTERDGRARWWIVPLTWVWAMCHGFWFIGVGLSLVCWLGIAADRAVQRRLDVRQALRTLLVPVLSFAVVLASPAGPGVLTAPFAVNDTKRYISEWRPTTLTVPGSITGAVVLLVVLVLWVRRRPVSVLRLLLILTAGFLLFYARRTVAVSGVVLAPLLAEGLQSFLEARRDVGTEREPPRRRPGRAEVRSLLAGAVVALAALAVAVPSTSSQPADVPVGLDADLDRLPPGTPVFNLYDIGGWMAWRHRDLAWVIDGLVVPYENAYVDRYFSAFYVHDDWPDVVASTGATVAVLRDGSGLAVAMQRAGWTSKVADGFVLLAAPGTPLP